MQQITLIESDKDNNRTHIGNGISLEIRGSKNGIAIQYDYDREIKRLIISPDLQWAVFYI